MTDASTVLTSESVKAPVLIEPPPLVSLQKRTVNADKENLCTQSKKKKTVTSSNKSKRYITLTAMHREQINVLNGIQEKVKNASDYLKQISSDINHLVNYTINKSIPNMNEVSESIDEISYEYHDEIIE